MQKTEWAGGFVAGERVEYVSLRKRGVVRGTSEGMEPLIAPEYVPVDLDGYDVPQWCPSSSLRRLS
tara:strand:+ start:383 stop:580 length:198 start_codon:yes stop_codon:yes gene_type:complete